MLKGRGENKAISLPSGMRLPCRVPPQKNGLPLAHAQWILCKPWQHFAARSPLNWCPGLPEKAFVHQVHRDGHPHENSLCHLPDIGLAVPWDHGLPEWSHSSPTFCSVFRGQLLCFRTDPFSNSSLCWLLATACLSPMVSQRFPMVCFMKYTLKLFFLTARCSISLFLETE